MSARSIPNDANIFRSKQDGKLFKEVPRHGSVAWLNDDSGWTELRFWAKVGYPKEWMTVDEYRSRTASIKQANITYYRLHPAELGRKIGKKRGQVSLLRRSLGTVGNAW